jgi:hypothetical protein
LYTNLRCACVDLDRFFLPPRPGISKELHDYVIGTDKLTKLATRVSRLKALMARLEEAQQPAGVLAHKLLDVASLQVPQTPLRLTKQMH